MESWKNVADKTDMENSSRVVNNDYVNINMEVATRPLIDLLSRMNTGVYVKDFVITSIPNPFTDGRVTFVGPSKNGLVEFTPAPRFVTSTNFEVTAFDTSDVEYKFFITLTCDTSFDSTPAIYYITNHPRLQSQVRRRNPLDPVGSNFKVEFGIPSSTEVACSQDDALLYYAASWRSSIGAKDVISNRNFNIGDISSHVEENHVIHSMGVDQRRHIMYLGFKDKDTTPIADFFLKIYLGPYDRYGTGTQEIFITRLNINGFNGGVTRDLDVDSETGNIFSATVDNVEGCRIFKIDPDNGNIIARSENVHPSCHISFANDGYLYAYNTGLGNDVQRVDLNTLTFTPTGGETYIGVSDLSRPLYNH